MAYSGINLEVDPLYLQTKKYDARADRKWWQNFMNQGVVNKSTGALAITFNTGMTLNVAAGAAWVKGNNVDRQGMYHILLDDASTLTVDTADGDDPRIDTVIVRVFDHLYDGSGYYKGRIEIVPGTPTTGASLSNLNGKNDLSDLDDGSLSALALAYVLVPAGATSLTSTAVNILDARVNITLKSEAMTNAIGQGTSFPTSPANGEYIYEADAANGILWRFKYRTASSKWMFIGGSPLMSEVTTSQGSTSGTYADLATSGPSIAVPFAGDFEVEIGAHITAADGNPAVTYMSYAIGGTAASDGDAVLFTSASSTGNAQASVYRSRRKTLTAVTLLAKYRIASVSSGSTFANRWMKLRPISK
jgi:hypothetical protein